MRVKQTIRLRGIRTIQLGTHLGLPAARFLQGSAVKASYVGLRAEKKAWQSFRESFTHEG